jgi:hypothetical protein
LKPKPKKELSKADKKHLEMMEAIAKKARKRQSDPVAKSEARRAWVKERFTVKDPNRPEPWRPFLDATPEKVAGVGAKKDLFSTPVPTDFTDDMAYREAKAIAEAKKRAQSVAPAFNKGGYQPISPKDLHSIGKKV